MRSSFNFYKDDFELVFVCYKNDSGLLKLLPVQLSNFALFNGVLYFTFRRSDYCLTSFMERALANIKQKNELKKYWNIR